MKERRVLISEIHPYIIHLVEEAIPLLSELDKLPEGPEFDAIARRVDGMFMDIGHCLTEGIVEKVAEEMNRRARKGGQADSCPPRAVASLH